MIKKLKSIFIIVTILNISTHQKLSAEVWDLNNMQKDRTIYCLFKVVDKNNKLVRFDLVKCPPKGDKEKPDTIKYEADPGNYVDPEYHPGAIKVITDSPVSGYNIPDTYRIGEYTDHFEACKRCMEGCYGCGACLSRRNTEKSDNYESAEIRIFEGHPFKLVRIFTPFFITRETTLANLLGKKTTSVSVSNSFNQPIICKVTYAETVEPLNNINTKKQKTEYLGDPIANKTLKNKKKIPKIIPAGATAKLEIPYGNFPISLHCTNQNGDLDLPLSKRLANNAVRQFIGGLDVFEYEYSDSSGYYDVYYYGSSGDGGGE